jgi:hypothetical protein
MYFARRANDTPARAHVGLQTFNDQEVGEKVYREGKLEAVYGCCVNADRLNACIYGASIWVRRRRRSKRDAAADGEVMVGSIRSGCKAFLIVAGIAFSLTLAFAPLVDCRWTHRS